MDERVVIQKNGRRTGRWFEKQIASVYRALGARKVEHNVELIGNQIDVYVEMQAADGALHRVVVEAKDWRKPVGIQIINEFAIIIRNFRVRNIVDEGVIVSQKGFTKQARKAAEKYCIRLLTLEDLQMQLAHYQTERENISFSLILKILQVKNPIEDTFSEPLQRILGAVAGMAIGALLGWLLGMITVNNPLVGLAIGGVIGLIFGAFVGLRTIWLAVGAYNIVVLGMLIGAVLGIFTSAGAFPPPLEVVYGGLIGLIFGGLITNNITNMVENLLTNAVAIKIAKNTLGPIFGAWLGVFLNWIMHQPILLKFRVDDFRVNALYGIFIGFVFSTLALLFITYIFVLIGSTRDHKKLLF
jgi:hypothetical protein